MSRLNLDDALLETCGLALVGALSKRISPESLGPELPNEFKAPPLEANFQFVMNKPGIKLTLALAAFSIVLSMGVMLLNMLIWFATQLNLSLLSPETVTTATLMFFATLLVGSAVLALGLFYVFPAWKRGAAHTLPVF
jgi:hypothetical protein